MFEIMCRLVRHKNVMVPAAMTWLVGSCAMLFTVMIFRADPAWLKLLDFKFNNHLGTAFVLIICIVNLFVICYPWESKK